MYIYTHINAAMSICPTFLVAQTVKHLPAMQDTWVQSLGWEDPLEEEMATHPSTLAWKIPWRRSVVGYSPWGRKELDTTERLHFHFFLSPSPAVSTKPFSMSASPLLSSPANRFTSTVFPDSICVC